MPERMYRPSEAAKLIGISERDVRSAVSSGLLEVVPIGYGMKRPRYLITESAIEKWQKVSKCVYEQLATAKVKPKRAKRSEPPIGTEYDEYGNLRLMRKKDGENWGNAQWTK